MLGFILLGQCEMFYKLLNTGGILFNPDLAVEEVYSRVMLHFLIRISEHTIFGAFFHSDDEFAF